MLKPLPGNPLAPALAESWTTSPDGLAYEFVLRRGVKFHNGEPVTAEDVKFSFERYRGAAHKTLKERVAAVEIPEPGRVRIRLKQPWPDFLTFYSSATGAGWIVPKRYVERVGDEGFNKGHIEKKYKNLVQTGSAAFGNAATRIEAFVAAGGTYAYGSYADIDGLFREQAAELDRKRREATLHRLQQLVHEKAMFAPIWQLAVMGGFGARVEEPALGLITGYTFSGPYEDVRLKGK